MIVSRLGGTAVGQKFKSATRGLRRREKAPWSGVFLGGHHSLLDSEKGRKGPEAGVGKRVGGENEKRGRVQDKAPMLLSPGREPEKSKNRGIITLKIQAGRKALII